MFGSAGVGRCALSSGARQAGGCRGDTCSGRGFPGTFGLVAGDVELVVVRARTALYGDGGVTARLPHV